MYVRKEKSTLCLRCGKPKEPQRVSRYSYCLKCQYVFVAKSYRNHPYKEYSEEKKMKHRCRVIVFNAIKQGKLIKQPCEICRGLPSEAHHADYNKPLEIRWLCRKHHAQIHGRRQEKVKETPPVRLLQPHPGAVFHVEHSVVVDALRAILAKEVKAYEQWQKMFRPQLKITRQLQKERDFKKRISSFKVAIQAFK